MLSSRAALRMINASLWNVLWILWMTFLIFDCVSYRLVRVPDEQIVNDDHYPKSAEHRSKVNSGLPIKYTIATICIIHGDRKRLTPVLYREEIDTKAKAIPTVA